MHSAVCIVVHGRMCVLDERVGRVLRNALFRMCNCASALSLLTSPAPCSSGTRRFGWKAAAFQSRPWEGILRVHTCVFTRCALGLLPPLFQKNQQQQQQKILIASSFSS